MPISTSKLRDLLLTSGFNFFCGVPCSYLTGLINGIISDDNCKYIGATSEGEAIGLASGAWLAGKNPVVIMQNSGLGNAVNPLTSLTFPFSIPLLLFVSWRGEPGRQDEPQHELMGKITPDLLESMNIEYSFIPSNFQDMYDILQRALHAIMQERRSFAIIVQEDALQDDCGTLTIEVNKLLSGELSRYAALEIIQKKYPKKIPIIATTGKTGRELYTIGDRDNQLYMVGSMGCASAVAAGLSLNLISKVLVIDGDGAALMKAGNMATIGSLNIKNLIHIILDNGTHDSTGGQLTVSKNIDFCGIAKAMGYPFVYECHTMHELQNAINASLLNNGATFIRCHILPGSVYPLGRPKLKPVEVANRFKKSLAVN